MDEISGLPDELLVKILSFLPTKVAVSTSVLSKRWKFLWMSLPKLDYSVTRKSVRDFINKNLPLHRALVIESLRLDLLCYFKPEDIKLWVETAVSRSVCELEVEISYYSPFHCENILPSSLYTCESLVILKLREVTLMDVPSMVCLPSLKTLLLHVVKYADDESLQRLLSVCHVLEDLDVHFFYDDIIKKFRVIVPTLKKLSLFIPGELYLDGYEIDTPSLEYFRLESLRHSGHYTLLRNMPKLREAYIDVESRVLKSFVGSITSVKHLTICSEDVYGDGFVFDKLEHLKLCLCKRDSSNLLAQLLKDSPNLRVLDVSVFRYHPDRECNDIVCWKQPSDVPECLFSSLQIFKWSRYFGRPQDRDAAVYILKNARSLKTATILADTTKHNVSNLKIMEELTFFPRASSTCELVFVNDNRTH